MTEEGLASSLMVALLGLVALMALATADAANVLVSRSRAQAAADAAALAAAVASLTSEEHREPEQAAENLAEANGAELEWCECEGPYEVRVMVSMATRIRMLGIAPSRVEASATAALDLGRVFDPP